MSEYICIQNFDTNEYWKIWVSKNWKEWMSKKNHIENIWIFKYICYYILKWTMRFWFQNCRVFVELISMHCIASIGASGDAEKSELLRLDIARHWNNCCRKMAGIKCGNRHWLRFGMDWLRAKIWNWERKKVEDLGLLAGELPDMELRGGEKSLK